MSEELFKKTEERMKKTIQALIRELATLRTGRASPSLIERVKVEAYNSQLPHNQLAVITTPQSTTLMVKPFDKNILQNIEKAILKSNIGLTPIAKEDYILINIPSLTQERREQLIKIARKEEETSKVGIRNIRRDTKEEIEQMLKKKEISEDEKHRKLEKLQKLTEKHIKEIEDILEKKEEEIKER
jgi:ribosome recycling factor